MVVSQEREQSSQNNVAEFENSREKQQYMTLSQNQVFERRILPETSFCSFLTHVYLVSCRGAYKFAGLHHGALVLR